MCARVEDVLHCLAWTLAEGERRHRCDSRDTINPLLELVIYIHVKIQGIQDI